METPLFARVLRRFNVAASEPGYAVVDPATGAQIASVPNTARAAVVRSAISAANTAKCASPKERAAMLAKWNSVLLQNLDDLAAIATLESGKPLREAKGEVAYAASYILYASHQALTTTGATIPSAHPKNKTRLWTVKSPVGVCGLITPWNFPLAMATRKIGPALAAGNACILKPAPETPLSALALRLLASDAGIPENLFQVLTADRENAKHVVGKELMLDPTVRKVSFTGSSPAGIALMEQASGTMKRVSMELGGNAPFIVFDDADIVRAVDGCFAAKFRNAGQTCISVNRVFVHEKVHDEFVAKLTEKVKGLKVGNGFDASVTVGPLINPAAVAKVNHLVQSSLDKGASLLYKADLTQAVAESGGYFYVPTILGNVTDSMPVFETEVFGPVVSISKFSAEDEVIQRANDTPFGLAGYFYSKDVSRVHRVSEALKVGMVGVNESAISTELAPFGGVKLSGVGREGSAQGIEEYLDTKYVCLGL
ncbi:hypothetical protein HDU80_010084 [Chytriomyces hyalinus]|nr:hypothetical protein HDU80_010084 [Chytriomyces hyalinus]